MGRVIRKECYLRTVAHFRVNHKVARATRDHSQRDSGRLRKVCSLSGCSWCVPCRHRLRIDITVLIQAEAHLTASFVLCVGLSLWVLA